METAVTYNRFSPGPNQREESITGQIRENHRLAKQKGLKVIHDYIDRSLTGRSEDRPQFQQMIKDAEKGLFKYIICYQTARFARNSYDAIVYKKKLKKYGVKVIYSKMSIPEGPEGIILERVLEALDEYYSEELKQKVIRGLYDNALQGKSVGGTTPYGLMLDENGRYVVDEEKSLIVREIFQRYAAGERAIDICEDLNNRGLRTAKGNLFNKSSLPRFMKQVKYIGLLQFTSKDEDLESVSNEDAIPAIISKELFEKVQKRIESNKHRKSKKRLDDIYFLLSGKVYDGNCGGALIGDSGTSKNGETYYYYTCQNKKHRKGCKTKSVRKEYLEDLVVSTTRELVLNDELIEFISDCIMKLQEKNIDNTMLKVAEKELSNVKVSIKNLLKAIEQGIITDTTRERLLELEARQAQLEAEVKLESHKITAPKVKKEQVIFWLEQFREGHANKELYKKQVIDTLVDAVVLNEETVTIAYKWSGDNDIIDVDRKALKNSSDSVRMSLINWSEFIFRRTLYII